MSNESGSGVRESQMLYVNDIPIQQRARNSSYDLFESKINIEELKTPDQAVITYYFLFGTFIETYNEGGGHVFRKMESLMPEEIRSICKVFEHNGLEFKSKPAISLIVRPDALKKFVDFFNDDFIEKQASLSRNEKSTVRFYVRILKEKLDQLQNNDQENEEVIDLARRLSGEAWENYSRELKKPGDEVVEGEKKRTKVHEQTHYVTTKQKWRGIIGKINELHVFVFRDYKKADLGENEAELRRLMDSLARTHNLIQAAMEAEAFIHECLSSNTIGPKTEYSHYAWSKRLLSLLKKFEEVRVIDREEVVGKKQLEVDYILRGELVPSEIGSSRYMEHDTGALLLLMADEENVDELVESQDFSSLGDVTKLKFDVLEKIATLLADDAASEALLRAKYDLIQKLIVKLTASFVDQYRLLVQDPVIIAAMDDKKREDYQAFVDFCDNNKDMFDDEVLIIQPVEIKKKEVGLVNRFLARVLTRKRKMA